MTANKVKQLGWTPVNINSLEERTYVITGSTSGIGLETTRLLLANNATVIMLNRNISKSLDIMLLLKQEFGEDVRVSFIPMDLSDLSNVKKAATEVLQTTPKIDALICNAAIAQIPKRELTKDGFESQLGTNHLGHFLLSGMLFRRIEETSGRIVVVSSLGYNLGLKRIKFEDINWENNYTPNAAYSQSKLAQMMFAFELQDRIKSRALKTQIFVCHPGSSATSLMATNGGLVTRFIFWLMTKTPIVQTAQKGAYPTVMCSTETNLEQRALYGPTGALEFTGPVGKGTLNSHAYDKISTEKLWKKSEEEINFKWDF